MIIFSSNEERYGSLVESSPLSIPLFDGIKCTFPGEVEHEQDGHCVIADKG